MTKNFFEYGPWRIEFTEYKPGEEHWKNYYNWRLTNNGVEREKAFGLYMPEGLTEWSMSHMLSLLIKQKIPTKIRKR